MIGMPRLQARPTEGRSTADELVSAACWMCHWEQHHTCVPGVGLAGNPEGALSTDPGGDGGYMGHHEHNIVYFTQRSDPPSANCMHAVLIKVA